ncbi:phosphotransferase [Actinopolymorpha alba]|uniref:phosphotransferase n=1 Tax=Actinopolymorpha alba TaxID=533267 RepID=UPI0003A5EA2F|nr:phosphotransferase [Actinopolymorpha alba]
MAATDHERHGARLRTWWADFNRPSASADNVRHLIEAVAPGATATDLGGCLSLNLLLRPINLVVRVHQPFVSRRRLLALQQLRRQLAGSGLNVADPLPARRRPLLRCGDSWAELEAYVPHVDLAATWDNYVWMFRGIGRLHRALAVVDTEIPRPVISTYAPPGSLRRWMSVTEQALRHDSRVRDLLRRSRKLLRSLAAQWIPQTALPTQLIHGDGKLSNIRRTPAGETAYLDFGFAAFRPRIHDLGHSLAWMVLRPDDSGTAESFPWWDRVPDLLGEYEDAAHTRLTNLELLALPASMAAVTAYQPAVAGFARDPITKLRDPTVDRFLRIGQWILANRQAVIDTARHTGADPRSDAGG